MFKWISIIKNFLTNESLFKIPKLCFKITAFDRSNPQKFVHCFLIASIAYSGFFEFMFIVKNLKDILTLAEALGNFSSAILAFVKGLTFVFYLEKVYSLKLKIEQLNGEGLYLLNSQSKTTQYLP
jgi:hypothetical protein